MSISNTISFLWIYDKCWVWEQLYCRDNVKLILTRVSPVSALRYLSLGSSQAGGQPEVSREEGRTKQTSPANVYEVAKPILQGCHAVPTKLKILLDRALSVLSQEEVVMIITSCGWHLEDYQRGYKLKVGAQCNVRRVWRPVLAPIVVLYYILVTSESLLGSTFSLVSEIALIRKLYNVDAYLWANHHC